MPETKPELPYLPSEEKRPDIKAWDEACNAAMRRHLVQVEQDQAERSTED